MTTDEVKQLIERGLPGSSATVTDLTGSGDHFRADVVCTAFKGKTLIEQHKMVYDALGALVGGAIHALQLSTKAT
jgi:stress-induced morphogen